NNRAGTPRRPSEDSLPCPEAAMPDEGSITRCITLLKRGDRDGAQVLWERYISRLVGLARTRLRGTPRRAAAEEDVALRPAPASPAGPSEASSPGSRTAMPSGNCSSS